MIEQAAPTEQIITCNTPGPRNNFGRPKLVLKSENRNEQDGLWAYCKTCQEPHWYSRKQVVAMWERGESVQCVAPGEPRV
jgi:hypothetical protein